MLYAIIILVGVYISNCILSFGLLGIIWLFERYDLSGWMVLVCAAFFTGIELLIALADD